MFLSLLNPTVVEFCPKYIGWLTLFLKELKLELDMGNGDDFPNYTRAKFNGME